MATFRWKALQEYSPFGQLLASFMWEQRPPLNPTQIADLTQIEYLTVYRWFTYNATPDPAHLIRIAQHTPISLQALFVAAGYGSAAFPLYSQEEAWEYVREQVTIATTIGLDDHDTALRVLQLVREEVLGQHVPIEQEEADVTHSLPKAEETTT